MPLRSTTYSKGWENKYSWLKEGSNCYLAKCKYCQCEFKINSGGMGQVLRHSESKKHQDIEVARQSQLRFFQNANNTSTGVEIGLLSDKEKLMRAEITQALKIVECNQSFASTNDDSFSFQLMFPDSEIAKSYSQCETKVKYVLQHGIAPYLKDLLKTEFRDKPFVFKFDETTTSQVKKQYDAYMQFWSETKNAVVCMYIGSTFMGHCTSKDLLNNYMGMSRTMEWNPDLMIHLGMDGPRVNESFANKLFCDVSETFNTVFLDIGTCTLHTVHNAFRKGVKAFNLPFDDFITDVTFFFKLSAARREDYRTMEIITDIATKFTIRHVSSRWLSMKKACLRVLEQWDNLEQYFMKFLPSQKNFKREVESLQRYKRIINVLKDPIAKAGFCFIAFAATDFEDYLLKMQRNDPMIHRMHDCFKELLFGLMSKFILKASISQEVDATKPLICEKLGMVKVDTASNQQPLMKIDIGTRSKTLIKEGVSQSEQLKFRERCLEFYTVATKYLQEKLPIQNKIIKNAKYFQPENRSKTASLVAISQLASAVISVLKNQVTKVFSVGIEENSEDICDLIRTQWRAYQMETIPNEWLRAANQNETSQNKHYQASYWKDVSVSWLDISYDNKLEFSLPIDKYWAKVFGLTDSDGRRKYPQLEALVKCILTISHGNSNPERGFSVNKAILDVHGSSIQEDTIVSLRIIKDYLLHIEGIKNFKFTKDLFLSVSSSRERYFLHLQHQRDLAAEARAARNAAVENDDDLNNVNEANNLENLQTEIKITEGAIKTAESLISDGNKILQGLLRKVPLDRKKIANASNQIDMGVETKRKKAEELSGLVKRRKVLQENRK